MVDDRVRHRLVVSGVVQGVGFRPAVWRLAQECGLSGDVRNDAEGVLIRVAGEHAARGCAQNRVQVSAPMASSPLTSPPILNWPLVMRTTYMVWTA